jgi:hypothetical protein
MPPDEPGQAQITPCAGLKARLEVVKVGILGEEGKNVPIDEYRVCW